MTNQEYYASVEKSRAAHADRQYKLFATGLSNSRRYAIPHSQTENPEILALTAAYFESKAYIKELGKKATRIDHDQHVAVITLLDNALRAHNTHIARSY